MNLPRSRHVLILEKGRPGLPDGTVRMYSGIPFRKEGGKWIYAGKKSAPKKSYVERQREKGITRATDPRHLNREDRKIEAAVARDIKRYGKHGPALRDHNRNQDVMDKPRHGYAQAIKHYEKMAKEWRERRHLATFSIDATISRLKKEWAERDPKEADRQRREAVKASMKPHYYIKYRDGRMQGFSSKKVRDDLVRQGKGTATSQKAFMAHASTRR